MEMFDILRAVCRTHSPVRGRCYAVEFEDGAVKIGSTQNATMRFRQLQDKYRGRRSEIIRIYIGEETDDVRYAESMAHYGLRPSEKREIFPITFGEAVRRIRRAVPDKEPLVINGREEVLREFPDLEEPEQRLRRCFYAIRDGLIALAQKEEAQ